MRSRRPPKGVSPGQWKIILWWRNEVKIAKRLAERAARRPKQAKLRRWEPGEGWRLVNPWDPKESFPDIAVAVDTIREMFGPGVYVDGLAVQRDDEILQ